MKRVLVVDDSRAIRLAIRRILEPLGFTVAEAEDGQRALDYLRTQAVPECVMLDIDMPVMDGLSCLSALRQDPRFDGTLVVMCSTHNSMEKIRTAITAGANEYIMKPFDPDILRAKLEQVELL